MSNEKLTTTTERTFKDEEYQSRLKQVRANMAQAEIDTLLVQSFANIFYLIGHQTTGLANFHCLVIPSQGEPYLVVRRLELLMAQASSWITNFTVWEDVDDPVEVTIQSLLEHGLTKGSIGLEQSALAVSARQFMLMQQHLTDADLMDASGLVEKCRRVKSSREIDYIRETGRMTVAGMQAALDQIGEGRSENEIAAAAVSTMYRQGSEYMAREPTVNSGTRSGIPHTTFKRRIMQRGDAVLLEMSASYNRYSAPLMRSAFIGAPSSEVEKWAEACVNGLEAALKTVAPGRTGGDIEKAVSDVYRQYGLSAGKRAGYSVGIGFPVTWMEAEIISLKQGDSTVLEPNMVFHIVPALRQPHRFAVGCSETVRVTETGVEILTGMERKLFIK
ncbi:Xaa-Pro peptidase family protein [Paenalcaligenes niemegkensis]|uniref:M24 family metallopeptidase n=1 Tax=Paenalcaligenes niemegkensis TaxID=2895469 RepID=UPI001EE95B0B|nr:Xaa-Pro peptidase family protein [Paenalcaligenes niemegkensis]MCQ9617685.1 Xaa-Pro peptidase family protein [Paenalcaligenes niemegkensis]